MTIHNFEYFIVLFLCGAVPLLFNVFHPASVFKNHWKTVGLTITPIACLWILADMVQTARGHWSFNPNFTSGIYVFNLPLEEIGFFFVIPFACLFTWIVVRDFTTWSDFFAKLKGK